MPPLTPRWMTRANLTLLIVILLLTVFSLSCRNHEDRPGSGSSGLITDPLVDTTGTWVGDWNTGTGAPADAGTVTMVIVQDPIDNSTSGTSQWLWLGDRADRFTNPDLDPDPPNDPPRCFSTSDMKSGVVVGNKLRSFTVVEQLVNPLGQGLVRVRANFTIDGETMIGTFKVEQFTNSDDRCDTVITRVDNTGYLFLTRVSS
jgi:hypothetical protein